MAMKKLLATTLLLATIGSISYTADVYAQQFECRAVRGNGTQSWVWRSDSQDYSYRRVRQMCRSSGAAVCNISCRVTGYAPAYGGPAYPGPDGGGQFSCTVMGLRGGHWVGSGPTMDAARWNARHLCRAYGITPCTIQSCVRNY